MKYIGLSNDEKFLFTNKGFYVLEETARFVPYNSKLLSELYKITQSDSEYNYNKGGISLTEWVSTPRKFLNMVLESFEFNSNDKMNILIEWDKKFENNLLITETTNKTVTKSLINESWVEIGVICEGLWDKIKQGASSAWSGLKKGVSFVAQKVIMPILKKGVIPFLRWIRRNLNSYIGIIADVILSVLPTVVVMKVVWGLIVLLDIYEIATGDYDPEDPERKQMPFIFLLTDLLSLIFTAATGKAASLLLKNGIKKGAVSPPVKSVFSSILKNLPKLNGFLKQVQAFLVRIFGKSVGGFISKILGYVDSVITKFVNWIKNILGHTAAELGTKQGLIKVAVAGGIGLGIAEFLGEKSFGEGKPNEYGKGKYIKQMQNNLLSMTQEGGEFNLGYKGPVTGVYDKQTGDAVYKLYQKLKMKPKREATPYIANMLGVSMEPSGLFKLIPQNYSIAFGDFVQKSSAKFASVAKKMGAKGVE